MKFSYRTLILLMGMLLLPATLRAESNNFLPIVSPLPTEATAVFTPDPCLECTTDYDKLKKVCNDININEFKAAAAKYLQCTGACGWDLDCWDGCGDDYIATRKESDVNRAKCEKLGEGIYADCVAMHCKPPSH